MKVAVIGTGRVGLPLALSLVDAGVQVLGVDLSERMRHAINVERRMPFDEPGYDEIVASGKLHITGDVRDAADCDYFIITVGTPLLAHIETDLSYVTKVIESLCEFLVPGQTIVMRSTTAAISSSASRSASKPPVSTSTITGRKPRNRSAMRPAMLLQRFSIGQA